MAEATGERRRVELAVGLVDGGLERRRRWRREVDAAEEKEER